MRISHPQLLGKSSSFGQYPTANYDEKYYHDADNYSGRIFEDDGTVRSLAGVDFTTAIGLTHYTIDYNPATKTVRPSTLTQVAVRSSANPGNYIFTADTTTSEIVLKLPAETDGFIPNPTETWDDEGFLIDCPLLCIDTHISWDNTVWDDEVNRIAIFIRRSQNV